MRNKIIRGDGTTVLSPIMSFHYKAQSNYEENIRYGAAIPSYIEANVRLLNGNMVSVGEVLTYYQTVVVDGYFDPDDPYDIPMGTYTVAVSEMIDNDTYRFVAYDELKKLDADFSNVLRYYIEQNNFPTTAWDLFYSAILESGVYPIQPSSMLWESIPISQFYSDSIKCRDIVEAAGALQGAYFSIDMNGDISFDSYAVKYKQLSPFNSSDQYIIAPTDQINYGLTPVFYKQDGLRQSEYSIQQVDSVQIIRSDGTLIGIANAVQSPTNIYYISGNLFADIAVINDWVTVNGVTASTLWNSIAEHVLTCIQSDTNYSNRETEVSLFPFRFPYILGAVTDIINTSGLRYSMPIMKIELSDSEVLVGSYGSKKYEKVISDYDTADQKSTSLDVRVNSLKSKIIPEQKAVTVPTTMPSGVNSIGYVHCLQSGAVVYVEAYIVRNTTEVSSWATLATGLPVPKLIDSTPVYQYFTDANASMARALFVRISSDGKLQFEYGKASSGTATYRFSMVYMTESI